MRAFWRAVGLFLAWWAGLLGCSGAALAGPPSSAITYGYDDLGRLIEASEPASNTAAYRWDAVGNLTSVLQEPSSAISVLQISPNSAAVGATVRIYGTAFSSIVSQDSIAFNGTAASISSATATELVVTVPSGASSGTISVSSPAGSANSPSAFTVIASGAPTIASVSASVASPGSAFTVSGTNFDANIANDELVVNQVFAHVGSATMSALNATVPSSAGSGAVKVATPYGETTGPDLFIPPSPYAASNVVSTARMSLGETQTVSINSPGKDAMVIFDAQAGQRVFVEMTNVTFNGCCSATVAIYEPRNQKLVSTQYINSSGGYIDTTALSTTGTYTIFVAAEGANTGSVTMHLYSVPPDFSASVRPSTSGISQVVTTTVPGQNAKVTFQGTQGERIFVDSSGSTYGSNLYASIQNPDGTNLVSPLILSSDIDTVTLPTTGTYTVFLDPQKNAIGSVTLTVYEVPPDFSASVTPSTSGAVQAVTTTVPGQNAKVTFQGTQGERIFVDSSTSTYGSYLNASIQNPDGTNLVSPRGLNSSSYYIDTVTLPTTGTYTIFPDPQKDQTGTIKLVVYEVPPDFSASVTPSTAGVSQVVTTTVPGQNAKVTFQGTQGGRIFVDSSGSTYGSNLNASIQNPDGTNLVSPRGLNSSSYYIDTVTLPTTGTYTIFLDPQKDQAGTIKLVVYEVPPDFSASVTPSTSGAVQAVTTTVPGQNGAITFQGSEGQRISIDSSAWNYGGTGCCNVQVSLKKPDGTNLVNPTYLYSTSPFIDAVTLPTSGTYTIFVDPQKDLTGSITLTTYSVPPDFSGTISIGGSPVTVSTSTPGQNASLTFSGPESKGIKLTASTVTIGTSTCCSTKVSIRKPDGTNLVAPTYIGTSGGTISSTLTVAGTYTIFVDSQSDATGKMTLTLIDPPVGALMSGAESLLPFTDTNGILGGPAVSALTGARSTGKPDGKPVGHKHTTRVGTHPSAAARRASSVQHHAAIKPEETPLQTALRFSPRQSAAWAPTASDRRGDWTTRLPTSPLTLLPALQGADETTALAGQTLRLNGIALANVTVSIEDTSVWTRTDKTGRFLLEGMPAGHHVLVVEGSTAGTHGERYGHFEIGVDLQRGITNVLGYTIWMPKLDRAHALNISSPTASDIALSTPHIPGLEVRIPKGSVITGSDGQPVRQLSITPVPVDRPPFPLPLGVSVPLYFTVQPGGAYLSKGAQLIYPNYTHLPPGQRVSFWNYDPDSRGWYIYGHGTVTRDAKQVVPDPGVRVWEFTGAMISGSPEPPASAPPPGSGAAEEGEGEGEGPSTEKPSAPTPPGPVSGGGDPVDLHSGLVVMRKTDLSLRDTLPVALTRTYRPGDHNSYSFGVGTADNYYLRLWSVTNYQSADLVFPDGSRIHYVRTSAGTSLANAVYQAMPTPTVFYGSTLVYDSGGGWDLKLKNGLIFHFPDYKPLQWIRDRFGNQITITRDAENNLLKVTAPHGRWIEFTHEGGFNRITKATDNMGRTVSYAYDSPNRLASVTDANGGVTSYTYNIESELLTVTDPRGITYLTNQYDSSGRIVQQTLADGSTYKFAYTTNPSNGQITQTEVTDPDGNVRQASLNSEGYITSVTQAAKTSLAQTTTYQRQAGSDLVTSVTDPLGRTTSYSYDSFGDLTSITRLAGTPSARTASFSYGTPYSLLTGMTDPLGHTMSYGYDSKGELTSIADPLGHTTSIAYANQDGRPTAVTNPLEDTRTLSYTFGDLTAVTDPLGNTTRRYLDPAGRMVSASDRMGHTTRYSYDGLNDLTGVTDPDGNETTFAYDPNGDPLLVMDPRLGTTTFTYDSRDRPISRTDALNQTESYAYDPSSNLTNFTDRKGQTTTFKYDALNRLTFAGFNTTVGPGEKQTYESTIDYSYDAANRLTQAKDSVGGTFNKTWDEFDELTGESGPQGSIAYGYDADGRRTSTTVAGQPEVSDSYDAAGHLTAINGSQSVAVAYDAAGRRTSTMLPDGVEEQYSYDARSDLTGITYAHGTTTLGNLSYEYDPDRHRTAIWGSYARTSLPEAFSSASYDADNRLTSRGSQSYSYDANGNLTSDGSTTYAWNTRNQLTALGGATSASFAYDPFGRREQKTVNSATTSFLYDGQNVVQDLSGGSPQTNYLLGLGIDKRYARTDSAGTQSLLTDALGSTIALADGERNVKTSYTYDPFGKASASGEASPNAYQYTGRENDGTGLQYNRARYYNPSMGRFISEDPLRIPTTGTNFYGYANGNPMLYRDPFGLCVIEIACGFQKKVVTTVEEGGERVAEGAEETWEFVKNATPIGCLTKGKTSGRKNEGDGEESPGVCAIGKGIKNYLGCEAGSPIGLVYGSAAGFALAGPVGALAGAEIGEVAGCVGGALGGGGLPANPTEPAESGP